MDGFDPRTGVIVLGATNRPEILDHALSTAQSILASATPYTEPVAVRGATLYRARFSGFANQQAAKNACTYLVKRSFECLATSN